MWWRELILACVQFVVLEKMRIKILAEPLHFNGQPQETVNRMNEVYSRLSAFKNMDRKR